MLLLLSMAVRQGIRFGLTLLRRTTMRAKILVVSALLTCACSLACFVYVRQANAQGCTPCCALAKFPCDAPPQSNCTLCTSDAPIVCAKDQFKYTAWPTRNICGSAETGRYGCDSNPQTNPNRITCVWQTPCAGGPCNYNFLKYTCTGPPPGATPTPYAGTYVDPVLMGANCPS